MSTAPCPRKGRRAAITTPLQRGGGTKVVTCRYPTACKASQSRDDEGPPRYSERTTISASCRFSASAIRGSRDPPPCRMFQASSRMPGLYPFRVAAVSSRQRGTTQAATVLSRTAQAGRRIFVGILTPAAAHSGMQDERLAECRRLAGKLYSPGQRPIMQRYVKSTPSSFRGYGWPPGLADNTGVANGGSAS